MEFTKEGGEKFWFNFAAAAPSGEDGGESDAAAEAPECPPDADILPVAEADVPAYDEADLVGGEGSGYLQQRRQLEEQTAVNDVRVLTFKSWWYEDSEEPSAGNGMEAGSSTCHSFVRSFVYSLARLERGAHTAVKTSAVVRVCAVSHCFFQRG